MFGFRKNGLTSLPFLLPSASTRQRVREGRPRLETLEDRTAPAAGLLDPTFGQMGKVITDVGGDDRGSAMVRQADGKILVAGSTYNGDATRENFAVVRYTTSGVLDDTFGDRGKVITDLGGNDYGNALALQPDGKILVAGIMWNGDATGANFAVVRYTTSGVLDDTFGDRGNVITDLGDHDYGNALALQPDGQILVAGFTHSSDGTRENFAVVRYTMSGVLDDTFGDRGKVITDLGDHDYANALALQPDGQILVAGYRWNGDANVVDFAVVRYTTSGALDDTFGDRGKLITDLGCDDLTSALVLQPDGKILVTGGMWNGDATGANFAVVRYTTSGVLDDTFGNDGKVVTDLSTFDSAYALALEPNGKILVAGGARNSDVTWTDFAVVRYTTSGVLDDTFGDRGKVIADLGGEDLASALALEPNGKILVAGYTRNNDRTGYNFALVRYFGWEVRPPVLRGQARQVTHVLGHTQVFRRVVSDWAYSPEELPLHYELIGAIPAGVTLSAHQQVLTYQRPANFHGDVQIRFRISDWVHQTQVVTVTLKERRVPVIPVAPVPLSPLEAALDQLRALATQLSARLGSLIPNTWPPR